MNKLLFILILPILLSACGAQPAVDPAEVQNAIQQTIAANWTATFTPGPMGTFTSTWTPTAPPSQTPTPLPTNTPTLTPTTTPDLRLINAAPYDFLLTSADLPDEQRYNLNPTINLPVAPGPMFDINPYYQTLNTNPLHDREDADWGKWEGQADLEANGLVDGWMVTYVAGADADALYDDKDMIFDHVMLFRSIAGAQLMVSEYGWCTRPGTLYTLVDTDLHIGDLTGVCMYSETIGGIYREFYAIDFSYCNVYHSVWGRGMAPDIALVTLETVARALLARLEAAPLTNIVTYHP